MDKCKYCGNDMVRRYRKTDYCCVMCYRRATDESCLIHAKSAVAALTEEQRETLRFLVKYRANRTRTKRRENMDGR